MEEILIGEKKYISSKQAAKATGYAKDYIGQLCREGRVPARLVGRSWYVLESAIHDHRFGEPVSEKNEIEAISPIFQKTWEPPRYEASPVELLPDVKRLEKIEKPEPESAEEETEDIQQPQDAWKAWFDQPGVNQLAVSTIDDEEKGTEEQIPAEEEERPEEKEENVPIRAIYHPEYQPLPEELLPRRRAETRSSRVEEEHKEKTPRSGKVILSLQLAGAMLALFAAGSAVLGSGYFDKYVVSLGAIRMIAGVGVYSR
jgi:hypothetical protein